ncbi:Spt4/RpoE2 zinc finger-domain-containing protein [Annulohypoxylon bovei var. microspora]|nr:Spt4/RpoE2 zinc finger-domain-containing protein [Annulohypoxylon bovei var. microspora]
MEGPSNPTSPAGSSIVVQTAEQSDSGQQLESEISSSFESGSDDSHDTTMASQESPLANMYIPNNQWRYARACMVCSIIMVQSEFRTRGCPNCPFLDMKGSPEAIENCTSSQFNDVHLVVQPQTSWTSKWMRLKDFVPGIYAIKVNGSLPDDVKQTLLDDNHAIVPRDGSAQDID